MDDTETVMNQAEHLERAILDCVAETAEKSSACKPELFPMAVWAACAMVMGRMMAAGVEPHRWGGQVESGSRLILQTAEFFAPKIEALFAPEKTEPPTQTPAS